MQADVRHEWPVSVRVRVRVRVRVGVRVRVRVHPCRLTCGMSGRPSASVSLSSSNWREM